MTVTKKKRVSKRNKISWRKHVNISDVEEFLEDQRLEERLGPPLESLANDELFKLDVTPSEEGHLSKKAQKKLKFSKTPKCFSMLEPHTKVLDPIRKRNRVRSKEERKNDLIKKREKERRENGILRYRELQAINDQKVNEKRKLSEPKKGDFDKNIWNESDNNLYNEWFDKSTVKHNLAGTGKTQKIVKNPIKYKTSVIPSVELPHPGMSYNPSFDDHQDLLKIIAEKETKLIKEEEHLNRVTKDMFSKVSVKQRDNMWLEEMSQGLPTQKTENSEDETDNEYKSVNPPTKNRKKTLKQRRKQKEQIKLELMKKMAKLAKKKITDIQNLRILNKQINRSDSKAEKMREKRRKSQLIKKKLPKRLSAMKFEEAELEFNMGPDISGNLRNLKKEGSLLNDRFKSLQKRNIIEPSIRRHRKKSKVKVYTKPGHKEDWKTTVAR